MPSFKWCVRVRILANLVLGVALLGLPLIHFAIPAEWAPDPHWVRMFGIALIFIALAHIASAVAPEWAMSSNLFVILGPILPIILLLWLSWQVSNPAILAIALYETVFLLLLNWSFRRDGLRELMRKP